MFVITFNNSSRVVQISECKLHSVVEALGDIPGLTNFTYNLQGELPSGSFSINVGGIAKRVDYQVRTVDQKFSASATGD
jgi:hypothetical protein